MNNKDNTWYLNRSSTHGVGAFAKKKLPTGTVIGVGVNFTLGIVPQITYFASKINHSKNFNVVLRLSDDRSVYNVLAYRDIEQGNEIFLDYSDTPFYIKGPKKDWK